ncbi:hypothetical protein PpBr36_05466 [Pyricularia pennisetigena]|uniref:hypothetical protein n=1 Tax=Pyricularia pennisetigena TaxID=1578925 RepID=UPI001152E185|nr:hypothetical protein PpBr36_05466 [Pyricularia pennisetigena]TLS27446.1 hypothetical protein PpBr36_05466 [Pyricularia pennisetigena]
MDLQQRIAMLNTKNCSGKRLRGNRERRTPPRGRKRQSASAVDCRWGLLWLMLDPPTALMPGLLRTVCWERDLHGSDLLMHLPSKASQQRCPSGDEAAGLNSRDVMVAMGELANDILGYEGGRRHSRRLECGGRRGVDDRVAVVWNGDSNCRAARYPRRVRDGLLFVTTGLRVSRPARPSSTPQQAERVKAATRLKSACSHGRELWTWGLALDSRVVA